MQILRGDEDLTHDRTGQQDQNIIDRIETNISSAVPARTDRGTYQDHGRQRRYRGKSQMNRENKKKKYDKKYYRHIHARTHLHVRRAAGRSFQPAPAPITGITALTVFTASTLTTSRETESQTVMAVWNRLGSGSGRAENGRSSIDASDAEK